MAEYASTLDTAAAAALIQAAPDPLVVLTHAKPDGDAFGSTVALTAALRSRGRDVRAYLAPPVPAALQKLAGADLAEVFQEGGKLPDAGLYLVLDTGATGQLGPVTEAMTPDRLQRTLIVDHHLSGDLPAANKLIDGTAAACAEIVAELIEELLGELSCPDEDCQRTITEGLFVGIASDTGWFRFSNTRPRTHELAARLLRAGVDHARLYRGLEQTERPQKLALLTRALDSLHLIAGGRAAVMVLSKEDFAETGALQEETERLIDVPQQIGDLQVVALLSEVGSGDSVSTRMSFRSKPDPDAANVAQLAHQFGGGGHARAAGASFDGPAEKILPEVEKALRDAVTG
ncbi:MAG: DHH family phosphoesterase [Phycisphaeraceae bacterium]